MQPFKNLLDYYKHELSQAVKLYKQSLISYDERKFIEMNIYKKLSQYLTKIRMFQQANSFLTQAEQIEEYLKYSDLSTIRIA